MSTESNRERLLNLVKDLPELLPGWRFNSLPLKHDPEAIELIGERGAAICFRLRVDQPAGRASVFGRFPGRCAPGHWGVLGYNEPMPAINFSLSRSAQAVANDIKRRFLPGYLCLHAKCLIAQQARAVENEAFSHRVDAFLKIAPLKHIPKSAPNRPRLFLPGYEMGVEIHFTDIERCNVELTSLPCDVAMEIVGIVAAARLKRGLQGDEN